MSKLTCNVTDCANYAEGCCCRPGIEIEGACACGCGQTCCSSFEKEGDASPENSAPGEHRPDPETDIRCDACNCEHNSQGCCDADCVCVKCECEGLAGTKGETECATFRCKS